MYMFLKTPNWCKSFRNLLIRIRMASQTHPGGRTFLLSQYAIYLEHCKHLQYINVIHPSSEFRFYWEIYMMFIFGFQFIVIPLDIATYSTVIHGGIKWNILRKFLDLVCLVDICLSFCTGYYNYSPKTIILNPLKIAKHYTLTYFFPDIISSVLAHMDIFATSTSSIQTIKSFSLFKLVRIFTFISYCRNFAEYFKLSYKVHHISMVILLLSYYLHVIACTNIFILYTVKNHGKAFWRVDIDLVKRSFIHQYVNSIYKALQIANCMDIGLKALSSISQIYVLVLWILSKIIYIFLISYILRIVIAKRSANVKYIELIRQLKEYMKHQQLPESLQKRLLVYCDFHYQKAYFLESEIISNIPGYLRQELAVYRCKPMIQKVEFLRNITPITLLRIIKCLKFEVYLVNDVILKAETPGYFMYFLSVGSVAVYSVKGQEIIHLHEGDHFGEVAIIDPSIHRIASVVAIEFCEVYRLDRKDFMRAIAPYPALVSKIKQIAKARRDATESHFQRYHSTVI